MSAGEPEQVVHQLGAAEHRPHAVERGAHVGQATHARRELVLPFGRGRLTPRQRRRRRWDRTTVAAERSAVSSSCCVSASRRARSARYARTSARRYSRLKWSNTRLADVGPPLVVRAPPRVRPLDDARGVAPTHAAARSRRATDDDVARHRPLAVADRGGDDLGHAHVALHRGGGVGLGAAHLAAAA